MSKIFIPKSNCKAITGQYWEFFNISFNVEELKTFQNEKWYVNLTMSKRREADQFGNTHIVCLNEYKPKRQKQILIFKLNYETKRNSRRNNRATTRTQ